MIVPETERIYLAKGATDLRKSINTLAALVQASFGMDPYDKSMYVFCNRSRNRLKILQYDKNGFWLFYKALDAGKFAWPKETDGLMELTEEVIKERFLDAFNQLMHNRDELIEDCRLAQNVFCDTTAIDTELAELFREIEVVTELSRKAIYENARSAVDQKEWTERNNAYLERHHKASKQVDELEAIKRERLGKGKIIEGFIKDIESRPLAIAEFDEKLWLAVIEQVTVNQDGAMTFRFKNGSEVTA